MKTPLFFFLQAYSVYDEEIGYCQGQSFLAAVLLLHVSKQNLHSPEAVQQIKVKWS